MKITQKMNENHHCISSATGGPPWPFFPRPQLRLESRLGGTLAGKNNSQLYIRAGGTRPFFFVLLQGGCPTIHLVEKPKPIIFLASRLKLFGLMPSGWEVCVAQNVPG